VEVVVLKSRLGFKSGSLSVFNQIGLISGLKEFVHVLESSASELEALPASSF